jgi:hypothetical protein
VVDQAFNHGPVSGNANLHHVYKMKTPSITTRFRFFTTTAIIALLCMTLIIASCSLLPTPRTEIRGVVLDEASDQPVAGALVTIRATTFRSTTDDEGFFSLSIPKSEETVESDEGVEVTAWASGFYIAYLNTNLPVKGELTLRLRTLHSIDYKDYEWLDPTPSTEVDGACGNCHPMILPQWENNAHGESVNNDRFYSFYNGTDIEGGEEVHPGYLRDFPGTSGNCGACHAPGAAVDANFNTDMNAVRGSITAGIHCDFCHKIGGIYLDPKTSSPYPNTPGVLSMRVLRPPEGDQIFLGPYPDIHDPDTYLPEMQESLFCAPCHQFSFWGTLIYNSYGEWLDSSYAEEGVTCQSCHMPPSGDAIFALSEQGGLAHPPETIPSHFQLGVREESFMRDSVEFEVSTIREGDLLDVAVTIKNVRAGHHIPTDHPGRHLLLLVQAETESGNPLSLSGGPTVPAWGGDYAGMMGTGYAKVLRDVKTGEAPVVSYWKQTIIVSDNRIPANASNTTTFTFEVETDETINLNLRLIFRRIYQPIAERYGWDTGEILMAEEEVIVIP